MGIARAHTQCPGDRGVKKPYTLGKVGVAVKEELEK